MQIVYISNRPAQLKETIAHVEYYMPFITDGIVVCPHSQHADFSSINSNIEFVTISENEILGNKYSSFQQLDHQKKNYLLRTEIARHSAINSEFIMSDDDARPLKSITLKYFVEDGRYHSYYFYDLDDWRFGFNEFDIGQQNTGQVLKYYGLPHLSYASHMPQIINRDIFLEMAEMLSNISQNHAVCEWSTYFNYAQSKYPEKFHQPGSFQTLCWPDFPTSWPHAVRPETYYFENFTSELYEIGQPFNGISTCFSNEQQDKQNIEKILRWYQHELRCQNPVSWKDINAMSYPLWKKILLFLLRPIKKIDKQINWQTSEKISQIASDVEQIQRSLERKRIK